MRVIGILVFVYSFTVNGNEECIPGRFGDDCSQNCSQNCHIPPNTVLLCNKDDGECYDGCKVGFYGGPCHQRCSRSCKGHVCYHLNGHCSEGCIDNRIGDFCEIVQENTIMSTTKDVHTQATTTETPPHGTSSETVAIAVSIPVVLVLVLVAALCIVFRWCQKRKPHQKNENDPEVGQELLLRDPSSLCVHGDLDKRYVDKQEHDTVVTELSEQVSTLMKQLQEMKEKERAQLADIRLSMWNLRPDSHQPSENSGFYTATDTMTGIGDEEFQQTADLSEIESGLGHKGDASKPRHSSGTVTDLRRQLADTRQELKASIERMYRLVIVHQKEAECTLQHIITETELKIKSRNPTKHVSTYTERAAFRHLTEYGSVIIKGRSGSGKSHLGYTLLERVKKSCSRTPVKISSPDEWNHIHKSSTLDAIKYVVMIDDIFGQTNLSLSSLDKWRQNFDLVWPLVESDQIWLVMTSRPEIITQVEPEIFGYEVVNKAKKIILDEGKYCLREAEKLEFLDKLCGKYIRQEDMEKIANMDTALGFPQCCTYFAANENAKCKGVEFFKKPFEFIRDLIECVKKNQPEVYFVLLLVFMNDGRLSMKELMSKEHEDKFERQFKIITPLCMLKKACPSKAGVIYVAQSVCGVYLSETSRCFLFSHRSVYDVLFVFLCKDSPDLGIRMSTPVMLQEFIRINPQNIERCKLSNVVCLDEEDYPVLAEKLREYLSNKNTQYIVLPHPALQDTKFLCMIFKDWNAADIYKLSKHQGEEVIKDIALPLCEKLGMPQTVTILKYNLFLSHVIMNRRKEFASQIIQSLLRLEEDIQPILNEALLCALYTCEKDIATTLLSHGAKPNMLCFSTLCNSPQLDADTTSTVISQIEGDGINLKLLLSIAVISCNKRVIRVLIRKLTTLSEKHEHFYNHCLELLLKINGNGHKDIAQMTTNAGHEVLEVMTLLEDAGGKFDSRRISLASSHKDPSVLRNLLLRSCDGIRVTNEFGQTPLHLACMYGGVDGVELLLKHGAELSVDKEGSTPFHYALKSCVDQKAKLKLLLNKNSTNDENLVNLTDSMKCTALHYAAQLLDSDCVKMLVEAQADTNVLDVNEQSPLFYVLYKVIPDAEDIYFGNTPLHSGLSPKKENCHKVVQTLLEKGADVGIRSKEDKTPLHFAARRQCLECVEMLLPISDVNAQDSDGNTALHLSYLSDEPHHHQVVQTLLENGADVGIRSKEDKTLLHFAARRQCLECVEMLLRMVDVNAQDNDGNTALHLSYLSDEPHHHEVIQTLLEKGADVGIRNKEGKTLLHFAARRQCLECVEMLLLMVDVNAQDSDGNTALHLSSLSDEPHYHQVIQTLLEKGADVGIWNKEDKTLLHFAARRQCLECVEMFLLMVDVNAQDSDGNTALHLSSLSDEPHYHQVIQTLLEKGADVGIRNKEGKTLLHFAARRQCLECVEMLLLMVDVNAQDSDGNTALHLSSLSDEPHYHEVIQALLEKGADVGIRNKEDKTLLHFAARRQCLECVEMLLLMVDVNAQDSDGNTALHLSYLSDEPHHHQVIQTLLEKGADVGIRNKEGKTLLHFAARRQCLECVEMLLPISDVNAQDSDGNTALHLSYLSDEPHYHEVIQTLLEKGADVGIWNKEGKTLLHFAARRQCLECVEMLLPISDVNAQDNDGNTALHLSYLSDEPHYHEVIQTLLEKGADVGIRNKEGKTLLHFAARRQCLECVEMLLPISDVNAQDSDGNTALHLSYLSDEPHHHEVIQALLEKGADVGIRNKEDKTPLHFAARRQCLECEMLLPMSDGNTAVLC